MNKPNLSHFFKSAQTTLSKHSPEILTGVGIAGMITTAVLAVKATPKALKLIEVKKQEENKDSLTPIETVKTTWKCYIPAVVTGATATACLIGASSVHLRRNAALLTAYTISETARSEYRENVLEALGEKKEKAIREKIDHKKLEEKPISKSEVIVTKKGKTRILEPLSMRYFESDQEAVRSAVNNINEYILKDLAGYASINDWYDEIGLPHTETGEYMGWNALNKMKIDFTADIADDGEPCLVINYEQSRPKYGYTTFM